MKNPRQPRPLMRAAQQGVMLIEALIAILIFSLGVLSIVGLQASSVRNATDAKYRSDAAFLADQIVGLMWGDVSNLASYAHNPTTDAGTCNFSGAASANANVSAWLGTTSKPGTVEGSLPGATSGKQQITVDAATGFVTVTVCWQGPQDPTAHMYSTAAQLRDN